MDTRVPPVPMEAAAAAEFRRRGHDPDEADFFASVLSSTHDALPDPPVSVDARLFALLPRDSVDRVSLLPDALLRKVVSRLPVKDAARTTVLSRRWCGVWCSAPLVLADSHILPAGTAIARDDVRRVALAVSRILTAHPRPFRCVHLTSSYMEEFPGLFAHWLQILAVKGIEELVLLNRPCPLDPLPATFLRMATLTRLYLGLWEFPDTAGLPRATSFPNLRELGLCNVILENVEDLDFILARCPVLETLCFKGKQDKMHLRLVSRSIRRLHIIGFFFEEITVVDAPCLERLILCGSRAKLKIGHSPKLHLLGYLDTGIQVLEVGNTIIKTGTKASPSTTVPSVKILALAVRFGIRDDAKMIPAILRCFPNVETLHIMSGETDKPTGKLNLKFWKESGTIECIRSRIQLLVFHDFRGDRRELSFLKFFFGSALALKEAVIVLAYGSFTSMEDMRSKVAPLETMKHASPDSLIKIVNRTDYDGGNLWSFKRASDYSLGDPFVNF